MGHNLRTLTLHVSWIPDGSVDLPVQFEKYLGPQAMYADFSHFNSEGKATRFTEEHARTLMLQTRLRSIGIGDQSYTVSLFILFFLRAFGIWALISLLKVVDILIRLL
jgi:hypothetical protein